MLPTYLIFTLTVIINIVIAAFVYANNPKHASNRLFAGLSLAISFWMITMLMTWIPEFFQMILPLVRLNLIATTSMNVLFLLFVQTVPNATFGMTPRRLGALIGAALAVMALSISPLTFSDIRIVQGVPQPIPGPGLLIFGLFELALICTTVTILFLKIKKSSGMTLLQLRLVLYGFLIMSGLLFGTIFVPILLIQDATLVPFAPMYVLLFLAPAGYAIFRHKLFDVKVVAAEMFSAALMLVNAFQLFLAGSTLDFTLRLATLIFVVFIGLLFIRSVRDEVSRREEIQVLATKLEASNKRLRQLDELKTTMVAIASHQIRGPLGGIRGYMTLFKDGDLGPLTPHQQDIISLNLNVLSRLINAVETFLDITKLESGKIMIKQEATDLDEVVSAIYKEFEIPAKKKGLELTYVKEANKTFRVNIDSEKTKHIVFNIIDNAFKYTTAGSIKVRLFEDGRNAYCEVADTGMGLAPEDVPRLFGKFERGELVVDRGGSGLGLYVVKMLTEMQGGRVWVSSPGVGKGAAFTISLPLVK
jgi:signal transduction histidine kinase